MNDDTALDVLSIPAVSDDLTPALVKRPRLKLPSVTLLLGATALIAVGFFGGALTGKHFGSSPGNSGRFSGLSGLGGNGRAGGLPGLGSGTGSTPGTGSSPSGGTAGTVKLIDGKTVYLQTSSGGIITVTVSPATKVTISTPGQLRNLHAGDTVTVQGSTSASGTIAATSIERR
jgi:hypothetical protein